MSSTKVKNVTISIDNLTSSTISSLKAFSSFIYTYVVILALNLIDNGLKKFLI